MTRILLVDDDPEVLAALGRLLRLHGHEVTPAASVRQALRSMREDAPPELLITDLIMEDQDGMSLIRHMRQAHPGVPVIAISGGGTHQPDSYLNAARQLGAVAAFRKPVPAEELLALLARITTSGQESRNRG